MMRLTARQIAIIDEIRQDRNAAEATLNIALKYHHNLTGEIEKRSSELWSELAEIHNLDLSEMAYQTKTIDGIAQIVPVEESK